MAQDEVDESLVVVVVDMNEALWKKRAAMRVSGSAQPRSPRRRKSVERKVDTADLLLLPQVLDVVLLFMNTVLLLNRENKVAAIASCPDGKFRFLFPGVRASEANMSSSTSSSSASPLPEQVCADQQKLEKTFKKQVRSLASVVAASSSDSKLKYKQSVSSALGAALCYCNRVIREEALNFGARQKLGARILLVQISEDDPTQYISSMNASFAAQKLGIPIDVCDFTEAGSTILRQMAHLSKGVLIKPSLNVTPSMLSQVFWNVFLPGKLSRDKLRLPDQPPVLLKASCFCHNRLVDQGYVCSVCLSVFCKTALECPTCGNRVRIQR